MIEQLADTFNDSFHVMHLAEEIPEGFESLEGRPQLSADAGIADVLQKLQDSDVVEVVEDGEVIGFVDRDQLQKPALRMWLFGLLILMEDNLVYAIPQIYPDDSWQEKISETRMGRAKELFAERQRRNQNGTLVHCLALGDKLGLFTRNARIREILEIGSAKAAKKLTNQIETLRNNLAHNQVMTDTDLETSLFVGGRMDRIIRAEGVKRIIENL